mmetsp:Transcript_40689/g.46638  ORF Transcript_40689/g.46638 Transcript_40689/m.46638 type:complete len:137 (+) Transcript_40689:227-637(+)
MHGLGRKLPKGPIRRKSNADSLKLHQVRKKSVFANYDIRSCSNMEYLESFKKLHIRNNSVSIDRYPLPQVNPGRLVTDKRSSIYVKREGITKKYELPRSDKVSSTKLKSDDGEEITQKNRFAGDETSTKIQEDQME